MKLFLKIFVLVLFAQLCGYFSLASSCDCQGSPPASNDPANKDVSGTQPLKPRLIARQPLPPAPEALT
jgi:hypothetical protein